MAVLLYTGINRLPALVYADVHLCNIDGDVIRYDMFQVRASLHRRVYQHKTSNIIEAMLKDIMFGAIDHVFVRGAGNRSALAALLVPNLLVLLLVPNPPLNFEGPLFWSVPCRARLYIYISSRGRYLTGISLPF